MSQSRITYNSDIFRRILHTGNMAQIEQNHFGYQSTDDKVYTSYKCEVNNISMRLGQTSDVALRLRQQLLHICMECNEHEEAEAIARDLRDIFNRRIGANFEDDLACLAASGTLALTIEAQGRYDEAENILLGLLRRDVGPGQAGARNSDPLRFHHCRTLGNLAFLYKAKGDYKKSASYFRQTMDIYKLELGAEHPLTLLTSGNLLRMHIALGDTVNAQQLLHDTEHVIRTEYEGKTADIWETLILIARMHTIQDQNSEALRILDEALKKDNSDSEERVPENDLRLVAISNIASINFTLGKKDEASAACGRLHDLYSNRKLHGLRLKPEILYLAMPDYYDGKPLGAQHGTEFLVEAFKSDIEHACGASSDLTRSAYTQVARQYYDQKRFDAAAKLFEQSIRDTSRSLPQLGPHGAGEGMRPGWKILAVVKRNFGKATQERQRQQTIEDLKSHLKGYPATRIVALEALAEIHQLQNRSYDAAIFFEVALSLCREHYSSRSTRATEIMIPLAQLYHDQNMAACSKALLTELRVVLESIGFTEPYAFSAWHNFADLTRRLGYFAEAQDIHRALLRFHEHRLGSGHEKILATKNNLARCLYKTGQREESERYLRAVLETSGNEQRCHNSQLRQAKKLLKLLLEEQQTQLPR